MPYFETDSIDDVYYKYSRQFFTPRTLTRIKDLFEKAEVRCIITGTNIKRKPNEAFENCGPIDFFLKLQQKKDRFIL